MRNNVKEEIFERKMSMIKKLRHEANLTQAQLSVAIGVATTTISRWEQEDASGVEPSMTIAEWVRFCRAVGIRFADLPTYFIYPLYSHSA